MKTLPTLTKKHISLVGALIGSGWDAAIFPYSSLHSAVLCTCV